MLPNANPAAKSGVLPAFGWGALEYLLMLLYFARENAIKDLNPEWCHFDTLVQLKKKIFQSWPQSRGISPTPFPTPEMRPKRLLLDCSHDHITLLVCCANNLILCLNVQSHIKMLNFISCFLLQGLISSVLHTSALSGVFIPPVVARPQCKDFSVKLNQK